MKVPEFYEKLGQLIESQYTDSINTTPTPQQQPQQLQPPPASTMPHMAPHMLPMGVPYMTEGTIFYMFLLPWICAVQTFKSYYDDGLNDKTVESPWIFYPIRSRYLDVLPSLSVDSIDMK